MRTQGAAHLEASRASEALSFIGAGEAVLSVFTNGQAHSPLGYMADGSVMSPDVSSHCHTPSEGDGTDSFAE